jgi:hypothetical protein
MLPLYVCCSKGDNSSLVSFPAFYLTLIMLNLYNGLAQVSSLEISIVNIEGVSVSKY